MKKFILLSVCLLFSIATETMARKKPNPPTKDAKPAEKTITTKGLFNVIKTDKDYFFEIPDSIIGRRFLVSVRYTSTPANSGLYGGEQVNYSTMYFEKSPNDQLLLRSELLMNTADSLDAVNRAILISNSNPIIGAFKIESHAKSLYKIKVSAFFQEDNAAIGLNQMAKKRFGLGMMLPSMSYIESIKTFPINTEVRTVKTWTSAQNNTYAGYETGKVTIGLNVSFILLPKIPMQRRLFDPRVGYFSDSFVQFSDFQQRVEKKRFITRWRLEPKDSVDAEKMKRGELVEPKKPIIYYVDPATPKRWRPYLIAGVNDWAKAFEKAGFKNAIMAKEWPDTDSTMSMEDARYSCIRYLASPIENAYGPQVHDPRSGEIIESHICWYHNVMKLVHDWYMIQAGTIDEAAQKMRFDDDLMGQLIRFVSSHEVGHTLGLRHNFGSSSTVPVDSLRNKLWVEAHGHTPSIMDYARFNYVAQPEDNISREGIFPRIGDYDMWAIQWGYTPTWDSYDDVSDHYELEALTSKMLKSNRRLWFGDGESNNVNDPRCQTEDLSSDVMKANEYGILNLKREVQELPDWTYQHGDIFGTNLLDAYQAVNNQFLRYISHVFRFVGGVYKDFKTVDQEGAIYTNVPAKRQREALAWLNRQVLEEPKWLINESYLNRLTKDPQSVTINVGNSLVRKLVAKSTLDNLNADYPATAYLPEVTELIFKELKSKVKVTAYRKALQSTFVNELTQYFKQSTTTSPARPTVLKTLTQLQHSLKMAGTDAASAAHYANLSDMISRALVIK